MTHFTILEMVNMIFILGECSRNCLLASRMYAARYPDAEKKPRPEAFDRLQQRFLETGSVAYKKKKVINRTVTNEENELMVLMTVQENPNISRAGIFQQIGIKPTSSHRILRKYKYHPYHMELHQELYENDFPKRMTFCNWVLGKIGEVPDILSKIMFSDEATFKNNGVVNKHNMHYYATENPHWVRNVDHQHRWSVNVWGGILGQYIIGPYFFEDRLTGDVYLHFLQNELPNLLHHVDNETRQNFWFQQDGAPPHYCQTVREFLSEWKENRWIGRGGPIAWPPRSPDLTPLDFYLWGYVKEQVFEEAPTTRENMKDRIREAFHNIRIETLQAVQENFVRRLHLCIQEQGRTFEHLVKIR